MTEQALNPRAITPLDLDHRTRAGTARWSQVSTTKIDNIAPIGRGTGPIGLAGGDVGALRASPQASYVADAVLAVDGEGTAI